MYSPPPNDPRSFGGNNDGLETVTEPMEGAFTVRMPAGWQNQAHLQREHSMNRIIVSAISPDGSTRIYLGDPRLPYFMPPSPYTDPQLMAFNPSFRIQPYTPAEQFFQDYLRHFFGNAPGFRITGIANSPAYQQFRGEEARRAGAQVQSTSVCIAFEHQYNGQPLHCRLHGLTINYGFLWVAELFTVSTIGDLDRYDKLALQIVTSQQTNPVWANAQQALHAQRMALGQQQLDHSRNMTSVMAQGHAQRMQDIQNFGQVNTQIHEQRMAQSDAQHQAWMQQQARDNIMQQSRVNAIREEHTVMDSGGNTYQVDSHHERYYVNKYDNTYIGTGGATEQHDLHQTHGVDPDDYEEVKIKW